MQKLPSLSITTHMCLKMSFIVPQFEQFINLLQLAIMSFFNSLPIFRSLSSFLRPQKRLKEFILWQLQICTTQLIFSLNVSFLTDSSEIFICMKKIIILILQINKPWQFSTVQASSMYLTNVVPLKAEHKPVKVSKLQSASTREIFALTIILII